MGAIWSPCLAVGLSRPVAGFLAFVISHFFPYRCRGRGLESRYWLCTWLCCEGEWFSAYFLACISSSCDYGHAADFEELHSVGEAGEE